MFHRRVGFPRLPIVLRSLQAVAIHPLAQSEIAKFNVGINDEPIPGDTFAHMQQVDIDWDPATLHTPEKHVS